MELLLRGAKIKLRNLHRLFARQKRSLISSASGALRVGEAEDEKSWAEALDEKNELLRADPVEAHLVWEPFASEL